jgi:hypothetical protein
MPRIQRSQLPRRLLEHLYGQALARKLSVDDLIALRHWLDGCPEVPEGPWFKRFPGFTLCGDATLPKTFLLAGRLPWGEEVG